MLTQLNWFDAIKAEAAKVEAAGAADLHKAGAFVEHAGSVIHHDWEAVSTDLEVAGKKCGANPICQELASYGVNVNHHIDALVIKQWLKEG